MNTRTAAVLVALSLAACGGEIGTDDAGQTGGGAGGGIAATGGGGGGESLDAGDEEDAGTDHDAGTNEDAGEEEDAGTIDAGHDAGTFIDAGPCSGTFYCDDFESYANAPIPNAMNLGPWRSTVQGDAGLFISGARVKSGSHALHIIAPAGAPSRGTLNQKKTDGGIIPGNRLFGRAWIHYATDADAGLPLAVHSWFFQANGPGADGGNTSINLGGGSTKLQLNYHFPRANEQSVQGGTVDAGAWHCVRWEYDATGPADGGVNEARVWLDGTKVIEVMTSKGWDMSRPWNNFDLGFNHYQTLNNRVDMSIDDFALADHAIDCP